MAVGVVQYLASPTVRGVHHDHLAPEVFGTRIRRRRASVRWHQILEELDPGSDRRAQTRDPHMRARHPGKPLLLDAPVLASAGDPQTQAAPIKGEARLGVFHDDRAMVDAEEQPVLFLPAGSALAARKLDQLERVIVGIPE